MAIANAINSGNGMVLGTCTAFTMAGGAYAFTGTLSNDTSVTFPTSGTLATTSQIPAGSALTKADDTNVTLTLGGSPTTALVNAASISAGWTGTLSGARGGTGVNNGASTITIGGNVTFSGAFTFAGAVTGNTSITFPTSGTLATTSQIPAGAALTKSDDTNVTLTLGGSASTSLINAASITAGWTGQLGVTRGGTGLASTTANQLLYSSATSTIAGLSSANSAALVTDSSGVPSMTASMTNGQVIVGSTGGTPAPATLTSTAGITFALGANTLAVNLQGGISAQNLIYNPNFLIWQRAAQTTSSSAVTLVIYPASSNTYTLDRWQLLSNVNQQVAITQTAITKSLILLSIQRINGQTGTGTIRFCQSLPIDNCGNLFTQVLTVSFRSACGATYSATSNALVVNVYEGTGTSSISGINGAFTGNITQTSTFNLTTSVATYSFTLAALNINTTQLAVEFAFTPTGTAGATDWFALKWVKLEIGGSRTQFLPQNLDQSLDACLPYYQKSFLPTTAPAQSAGTSTGELIYPATKAGATTNISPQIRYARPMFATPTVTLYNPSASNAQVRDETAGGDCSSSSAANNTVNGFYVTTTGNASTAVSNRLGVHWTAEAELT